MDPSLPASLATQEQELPTLIQRQVDVTSFQSNGCEKNKVFSEEISYQYGTTTHPELKVVSGKVSRVLEELYADIDWLERRNIELLDELREKQNAVDVIVTGLRAADITTSSICAYSSKDC